MKAHKTLAAALLLALAGGLANSSLAADSAAAAPASTAAPAREISKEQAIEMALKAHPGEVTKAYQDTKKGKKTWEVKIDGKDGKKWEIHYEIATGALVAEESK
ncbi:MAG TPA: PepSY domain-containing protein [Accumulibacter sp.]|uniref:PepSY domain-containing protein n=1 Tax=Accumulibacter sp. TaxID=2053492 RepID=UPI002638D156|nr:PepSY domain-containing protein [Accumulibacter sp.]MDS4055378.1 PepSY domain-containing protein [Accumulibacter sp.]HMV05608.1 PepSY domain-containing protein [Accumulibacter sp.]HMW63546.1 PepSY domain-containing protein [Accumulibacter sp.]HMW80016.1 PepSY domain-containing protein [Accumulibacter sp.]HMX67931.1 PepSY domain-containing protein [Accumulibacter sp.]